MTVYMPWYDPLAGVVRYTAYDIPWTVDGALDNRLEILTRLSWQNKANPDWLLLADGTTATTSPHFSGELHWPKDNMKLLRVTIDSIGPEQDFWYLSEEISNYGVVRPGDIGGNSFPMQWINSPISDYVLEYDFANDVIVTLKPDVVGHIVNASRTFYPDLFYDEGAGIFPFLQPQSSP
jgi:hypothetical protein